MVHLTCLSHFVFCLAAAAAAALAAQVGVFHTIWDNDLSMMTSVIGALLVGTAAYLGRQAWMVGSKCGDQDAFYGGPDASWGHLAERLCVMAGFVGTAIGLSLQAKSLAAGSTSFSALATSLFTTACGGVAAALIAIMTFNLEAGIRRAGQ